MAKKSSVSISKIAVIRIIIFLFIGFVLFTAYVNTVDYLTTSPIFAIKEVMIDRSIQFIDVRGLRDLKGTNIFKVNMKKLERQISRSYPYIAQLKVVRQLPDRILVLAKKRDPLLQVYYRNKYLVFDAEGMALYFVLKPTDLPLVVGIPEHHGFNLGVNLNGPELEKTVDILNMFRQLPVLRKWRIHTVQASNLAKIDIMVGENLHVILDQDVTEDKIEMLRVLVDSNKIGLNQVKYIDLRFKEPVIADNMDDNKE